MRALTDEQYFAAVADLTSKRALTFGKCGAVLVDFETRSILSCGYNHVRVEDPTQMKHAEEHALENYKGALTGKKAMFVTLSPCMDCAQRIVASNIKLVWHGDIHPDPKYRCLEALEWLKKQGVVAKEF